MLHGVMTEVVVLCNIGETMWASFSMFHKTLEQEKKLSKVMRPLSSKKKERKRN